VHLTMAAANERAFAFYTKLGFHKHRDLGTDWVLAMAL
jgi:ribosomal protein S18 acetylase RimI-like enzyme